MDADCVKEGRTSTRLRIYSQGGTLQGSTWDLRCDAVLSLRHDTVLSSHAGRWLEQQGLLAPGIMLAGIVLAALHLCHYLGGGVSLRTSNGQEVKLHMPLLDPPLAIAMSITSLILAVLGFHRVNKDLFETAFKSFDCLFIVFNFILSRLAEVLVVASITLQEDSVYVVACAVDAVCFLPVISAIGSIDAVRMKRTFKVPVLLVAAATFGAFWADASFGEQYKLFEQQERCIWQSSCRALNNVYKTGNWNSSLFVLKACVHYMAGHGLAVVRPWYDVGDSKIFYFESLSGEEDADNTEDVA
eukprot:TRINITY_DN73565_c0_g1_i1.p1 TRINITY_DN73565_c0_g1~~TRINITY_DN73565_c0_g1_i1.p1  ORF type:complete len:309 (+),score=50.37 TRINITY_DN73565_c0_g1_i1:26-928(+)